MNFYLKLLIKILEKSMTAKDSEILKKLNVSISTSNKMNFNTESINIELDHNQKNNSILSVELNTDLLDKEQIINDMPLLQVRYIESAD